MRRRHRNIAEYLRNATYTTPVTPAFKRCHVLAGNILILASMELSLLRKGPDVDRTRGLVVEYSPLIINYVTELTPAVSPARDVAYRFTQARRVKLLTKPVS